MTEITELAYATYALLMNSRKFMVSCRSDGDHHVVFDVHVEDRRGNKIVNSFIVSQSEIEEIDDYEKILEERVNEESKKALVTVVDRCLNN